MRVKIAKLHSELKVHSVSGTREWHIETQSPGELMDAAEQFRALADTCRDLSIAWAKTYVEEMDE